VKVSSATYVLTGCYAIAYQTIITPYRVQAGMIRGGGLQPPRLVASPAADDLHHEVARANPLYATLTDIRERIFVIMTRRTIVSDVVQASSSAACRGLSRSRS